MKKLFVTIILAFLCGISHLFAQDLTFDNLAGHPRLLLRKGDVTAMKVYASMSENARTIHKAIMDQADAILMAKPLTREDFNGEGAASGNEIGRRIFYLSYAFVMTEDMSYARRAESEMLAVSMFNDWNPADPDSIAEIAWALSIGYDWLYHSLPVHSRSIIGTAIYEKCLRGISSLDNIDDKALLSVMYASLATLERAPDFCKNLIEKIVTRYNTDVFANYTIDNKPHRSMKALAEDTACEVMAVAALQSALGEECGVDVPQEFMRTAEYLDFMVAPSGKTFNFGDLQNEPSVISSKYWFAAQNSDSSLVAVDERLIKAGNLPHGWNMPLHIIFASAVEFNKPAKRSNSWTSKGEAPIYIYRSGWNDSTDTYFAIKGGRPADPDSHMDGGAFIYEWEGVRWAVDAGAADKQAIAKALADGKSRWDMFRCGAVSHNTLTINGHNHKENGLAKMTESFTTASHKGAVVDLSELFADDVKSVVRRAELDKKNYLKISDHIVMDSYSGTIEWKIATYAKAEIAGPSLIKLTQDGKEIYMHLRCKSRSSATIWPAHEYLSFEPQDDGLQRVGFTIQAKAGQEIDIEVEISPVRNNLVSRLLSKFKGDKAAAK